MKGIALINANSLHIPLAAQSVHMIATSPPYFGLRDYGVADQLGLEPLHDCLAWAKGGKPVTLFEDFDMSHLAGIVRRTTKK